MLGAYLKPWYTSQCSVSAPQSDLDFLKLLKSQLSRGEIWEAALSKFLNHLWYLSSDLVLLALYDDNVSYVLRVAYEVFSRFLLGPHVATADNIGK